MGAVASPGRGRAQEGIAISPLVSALSVKRGSAVQCCGLTVDRYV